MKQTFLPFIPNTPIKIKATAEVDAEKLTFVSVGAGKTVASQPLSKIEAVMVQPVSAGAQRLEVFWTSLVRMGVFAVLIFVWTLCRNASDPMDVTYYVLLVLGSAILILPFSLLLSGILTSRHDLFRFHFNSSQNERLVSIEVDPAQEAEVRQALLSAGFKFGEQAGSRDVWECDQCGATVDADANVCPNCGAKFDPT